MELWINLTHLGYPNYSVSDTGKVKNEMTGKELSGSVGVNGYRHVMLRKNGIVKAEYVHRIVLLAFKGISAEISMTVDHINRNKLDNRLVNLRWVNK